ncbi:recombinase family protein [Aliifodinibius salicampi]|uniref:Recombinase family protein n=1 Tax=Fodinibius salicampi TaxID=1920655 RepID=A0ABT3PYK7_9BACT|nr:recombinase family protein [Fodinibius salicampi]MCW9712943.1 recombinase family protein [Fodinibius salicampi]
MSEPKAYSYIRFSTPEQKEGDTERRQTDAIENAENYADDEGLKLVSLRDEGISGFSGKHITEGALGEFLDKVKANKITAGSCLLIENIDRLTRLEPLKAQRLLIDILDAGIKLVVLGGGRRWEITEENYSKNGNIYRLTGEIQRAHDESKRKSEMLQETWQEKRKKAKEGGKKLTEICPMWLKLSDDKTEFKEREEVVEVIQKMFEMKLDKKGTYRIMKELNKKSYPFLEKSDRNSTGKWAKSTINRYLRDRRLIGEYNPHLKNRQTNEERKKIEGEVWEDYYPEVIKKNNFDAVQELMDQNSENNTGGPTGKMSNLFRHIVKCSECGGAMHHQNKGNGLRYLRCYNAQKGECEQTDTVRYDLYFEPSLLDYCKGLSVEELLPDAEQRDLKIKRKENELLSVKGALNDVKNKIKNYERILGETTSLKRQKRYDEILDDLDDEAEKLNQKIKDIEAELTQLREVAERTGQRIKDITDLWKRVEELDGQALIDLRVKLNQKLRRLIDKIEVGWKENIKGGQFLKLDLYFANEILREMRIPGDHKLPRKDESKGDVPLIALKDFEVSS